MGAAGTDNLDAGVFLVDKPAGISSFAVVGRMRKILHIKKVGHAGTLDPFATGLLVVCAGRPATRLISLIMQGDKEYLADLRLGVTTTTQDPEGDIVERREVGSIDSSAILQCLAAFRGPQMQVPPAYSALKHKGKPLYYYARKGITIEKEPRPIEIKELEPVDGDIDIVGPDALLRLRVVCSKGTYIRTLAADIGERLGCGAHLEALRRTKSGCFQIDGRRLDWQDLNAEDARQRCWHRMIPVGRVAKLLQ
ncbi:MAG: tRNA pseudouridine(55) synthase TruB [Deltaproteobacteria bacterium]|nr:MAG: tRNA pseudouridine(55) synthase TruB [Deltaproteobacteria bacterium]